MTSAVDGTTRGVPSSARLSRPHAKRLAIIVCVTFGVLSPLNLGICVALSRALDWDPVFASRVAAIPGNLLLLMMIVAPLLLRRYPQAARLRGYVIVWWVVSTFVNLSWQFPLLLFRDHFVNTEVTSENLPRFITWWGYGSVGAHYGEVTRYMIASESAWLVGMAIGITGLVVLLRGNSPLGYLLLGVGSTLQAYNSTYFLFGAGVIDRWDNMATDSWMGPFIYLGLGAIWPLAALTSAVICFRFLLSPQPR